MSSWDREKQYALDRKNKISLTLSSGSSTKSMLTLLSKKSAKRMTVFNYSIVDLGTFSSWDNTLCMSLFGLSSGRSVLGCWITPAILIATHPHFWCDLFTRATVAFSYYPLLSFNFSDSPLRRELQYTWYTVEDSGIADTASAI
uniref:Uncharacterized protein n=1 Tax=Nicotiana tabacum TaxID=4097 RepID=A0A1S3X9E6_TOBAC|nr:PREDICTED: uncharacterized protein LOC107762667 [Nicotiana tabacum]